MDRERLDSKSDTVRGGEEREKDKAEPSSGVEGVR